MLLGVFGGNDETFDFCTGLCPNQDVHTTCDPNNFETAVAELDFANLAAPPNYDTFRLALNIDTSDGNILKYGNDGFWESASATGGRARSLHPI